MKRRIGLGVLVAGLALLAGAGCNPFAPLLFTAYLTGADMEQRILFKFPEDTKRIAVVSYVPSSARLDMGHFDRELNERVAVRIFEYFESRRVHSKKEVVKASKVQRWQDAHPNWMNMDPGEIGRALGVDHLVTVEVNALSLYEECSNRMLYKGHAETKVKVYRIQPEYHDCVFDTPIVVDYPTKERPIPVADISFQRFRDGFVEHLAKRLSWVFTPHETGDQFDRAPITN